MTHLGQKVIPMWQVLVTDLRKNVTLVYVHYCTPKTLNILCNYNSIKYNQIFVFETKFISSLVTGSIHIYKDFVNNTKQQQFWPRSQLPILQHHKCSHIFKPCSEASGIGIGVVFIQEKFPISFSSENLRA